MRNHPNTAENSPTRGFTPLQFTQTVSYVPRPRRVRVSLGWFLLFAFVVALGTFGATYIVLWWVLR